MGWTALVPFKGSAPRKTRLASIFSPDERRQFSQRMFEHTCDTLNACAAVDELALLSDIHPAAWKGQFIQDEGRGLNAELTALVLDRPVQRLLIIHADLPMLAPADVSILLAEAEKAMIAIAPDRLVAGTNALALVNPVAFAFQFGTGSMKRHVDASRGQAYIIKRTGLSFDIDTPEDYYEACRIAPKTMKKLVHAVRR